MIIKNMASLKKNLNKQNFFRMWWQNYY